ncbi:MAG: dephospho-CoA kinase, partial [Candidatus Omnitrophica bacterium]|nr:dephospho-CoA kinase [Candidatus Omnitrophota bacterium]
MAKDKDDAIVAKLQEILDGAVEVRAGPFTYIYGAFRSRLSRKPILYLSQELLDVENRRELIITILHEAGVALGRHDRINEAVAQTLVLLSETGAKIIAITGFAGSGKTIAAEYLTSQGFSVIEVDAILRKDVPDALQQLLIQEFPDDQANGEGIINKYSGVNKGIIFRDRAVMARHDRHAMPFVAEIVLAKAREAISAGARVVFLDSAYINKVGISGVLSGIWCVLRDEELRKQGKLKIDSAKGITPAFTLAYFEKLKELLPTDAEYLQAATAVIDNNGTREELISCIDDCLSKLLGACVTTVGGLSRMTSAERLGLYIAVDGENMNVPHTRRVSQYVALLAPALGMRQEAIDILIGVTDVHDIGGLNLSAEGSKAV